jgi:hypothetical protein
MNQAPTYPKRIEIGTAEDFFRRSQERARRLDRGERLIPEMRVTFEDQGDLLQALMEQQGRIVEAIQTIEGILADSSTRNRRFSALIR